MKCVQCYNEMYIDGILINVDGDAVCSDECKTLYEADRDYFFEHIVDDEERCKKWLLSRD